MDNPYRKFGVLGRCIRLTDAMLHLFCSDRWNYRKIRSFGVFIGQIESYLQSIVGELPELEEALSTCRTLKATDFDSEEFDHQTLYDRLGYLESRLSKAFCETCGISDMG